MSVRDAVNKVIGLIPGKSTSVRDATTAVNLTTIPIYLSDFIKIADMPSPRITDFSFIPNNITSTGVTFLRWNVDNCSFKTVQGQMINSCKIHYTGDEPAADLMPTNLNPGVRFSNLNAGVYIYTLIAARGKVQAAPSMTTLTVSSPPPPPPPPQPQPQWFYFKMVNENSSVNPCFTIAQEATTESQAQQIVEEQNGGYTATPISYSEYINEDATCADDNGS
jgi:hypothetical protein